LESSNHSPILINGGEKLANGLDDLIKKLDRLENHLAEEVAPEVNKLFKESVEYSLINYYNSYDPENYQRTFNFMNGVLDSARTSGKGNVLTMSVNSGLMDNYNGWSGNAPFGSSYFINRKTSPGSNQLNASIAFDFFFMNGEHGHGRWWKKNSVPPYVHVNADIMSGFGKRVDKIMNNKIKQILK
jgi:hypothetical protein